MNAEALEEAPLLPGDTHSVVERYETMVYGIALTHTGSRGDADDVYQEVFLTYHRRRPEFNDEEHRKAWLITTALNCASRVRLSSWRTRVVPLAPEQVEVVSDDFTLATDEQNVLFRALRSLPENQRSVLYLFYFADLPVAQIADLLEVEPGTVRVRLSRGRAQMRDKLMGGLWDE
ncbi:RNA polymerase sigma-70 factor, ECF subfamily [Tessaracoccus bendigoensis DSM 12906]|uniref:RNA polymerase sigma-70 factor, ECF subfamily n=1 Tax=Tessaracoccus bendigoensis DSM 12906 TaxID=1123357 RepID=A0A1M6MCL1_9ACTN|nr:sigma-70 family RNA polymerase sigma factor [Tessaracoccus bendigoensis]SHJ81196.1 RNA polymerase sigma-70 factor, ECF subfamily [Tessaracoccus bendigoensis DSM 12906]